MRTSLLLLLALLGSVVAPMRVQAVDASDQFLEAYMSFQKGEKAEGAGNFRAAVGAYKKAISALDEISAQQSSWNPQIVKHRRDRAREALARVQPKAGTGGPEPVDDDVAGPMPGSDVPLIPEGFSPAEPLVEKPVAPRRATGGGDPIEEIQNRIRSLTEELQKTKGQLETQTQQREEFARKSEEAIKAAEEAAKKQAIAEGRAIRAEEVLINAERTSAGNVEQLKTLRAEVDAAKKQLRDIQIDREAAEELRQQYADRLTTASNRINTLGQDQAAGRKQSAEVEKKIAAMQKQLDAVLKEKGDLNTRLSKAEDQIKVVTQERDEALAQVARMKQAQKEVDKLLADNTALMAKLAEAEKTISQVKEEGVRKDEEIASLKTEVASVKTQLLATQKQSTQYQQQMADLQTKLETQAKDFTKLRADTATSAAERKKLQEENDVLRGIVVRQMKAEARRSETKKMVLTELAKLDLQSKSLLQQVDYLGQPVVKLTEKERRLFKQPLIEISDAEVSLAAPKESAGDEAAAPGAKTESEPDLPAGADAKLPESDAPAAAPLDQPPTAGSDAKNEPPTGAEAKPMANETGTAPGGDAPALPAAESSVPPAAPLEIASAKTSEGLSPKSSGKTPPADGDLPVQGAEENSSTLSVPDSSTPQVPKELLSLAREGKDHFERGNLREAEKTYEKLLTKAPNNLYALSNLGVVRFRSGKLKLAEEAFRKAIAVAPEDAFSHCTLGIVLYSEGKYDEAVNELTKAVALNPKNATAHNYLGITASQKGWQEAAQKELETATALDPNYADAYFNLAVVFATQQPPNKELARKHYKRATELGAEPDSALEQMIK